MTNQTIYIIDDEPQTVKLFAEYARLLGFRSISHTNAAAFFEKSEVYKDGSLMILDLNMPNMDGVEVMRQMVKTGKILPLILVSGYDSGVLHSAEQLAKAYSLDIIATLGKPFEFCTFKEIINKYSKLERPQDSRTKFNVTVSELRNALNQEQLILFYQPQINIATGAVVGVESLIRWQHPQHGLLYPELFISLAENNGLIGELTTKVIMQTINQVVKWKLKKLNLHISINISADSITSLSLPEQLGILLENHKIDPTMLTLEVTESTLMGELITSLDILTRLRMKGINLSIDDFGTGYSSLSQLYRIPFTELKVDQSFVLNMINDDDARGIVKTCIMLGHELNMKVVAEGVKDKKTLSLLSRMGCDIAQGNYIAKPMPAKELLLWINQRNKNNQEVDSLCLDF